MREPVYISDLDQTCHTPPIEQAEQAGLFVRIITIVAVVVMIILLMPFLVVWQYLQKKGSNGQRRR